MGHCLQTARRRLILFGRYPLPGKTKTRLIPALGPLGAAELQRRLTEKSLATIMAPGQCPAPVEFCHTGAGHGRVRRWLGRPHVRLSRQRGGDLGQRMRHAVYRAMDQGCRQVVLVGTDIPRMTPGHIRAAFEALNRRDVVLGPSRDGGYWLVGLRCKVDLFQGVPWGGSQVLQRTLDKAEKLGLTVRLLELLGDVDTEDDLRDTLPNHLRRRPYLSVVIPALNEARTIGTVIQNVTSHDCEVIVSDGGSSDQTAAIARSAGATVIQGMPGRSRQQNAGAAAASGCVLLFLHADTLLPADYGEQVFTTLMDHRVVGGAFRFRTDYDHWAMRIIEKTVQIRSTLFQMPYGDQGIFLPRAVFNKIGGFPATPIAEDLYLVRRLARRGRIAIAPGVALTSGRRWRNIGPWRTTLVNYMIAIGCIAGVNPNRLAPLYRLWGKQASK
jgi:rSAM/selenodomain-associated transferase 2/rSAM/selenodomain-associated transferase 1